MEPERRPDGTTRGGHEPPDEVQDRPEQNAGYDAAVRGEGTETIGTIEPDPDPAESTDADADAQRDQRDPEARPSTATERRRAAT